MLLEDAYCYKSQACMRCYVCVGHPPIHINARILLYGASMYVLLYIYMLLEDAYCYKSQACTYCYIYVRHTDHLLLLLSPVGILTSGTGIGSGGGGESAEVGSLMGSGGGGGGHLVSPQALQEMCR